MYQQAQQRPGTMEMTILGATLFVAVAGLGVLFLHDQAARESRVSIGSASGGDHEVVPARAEDAATTVSAVR
jgi:hypothetical protein